MSGLGFQILGLILGCMVRFRISVSVMVKVSLEFGCSVSFRVRVSVKVPGTNR